MVWTKSILFRNTDEYKVQRYIDNTNGTNANTSINANLNTITTTNANATTLTNTHTSTNASTHTKTARPGHVRRLRLGPEEAPPGTCYYY